MMLSTHVLLMLEANLLDASEVLIGASLEQCCERCRDTFLKAHNLQMLQMRLDEPVVELVGYLKKVQS